MRKSHHGVFRKRSVPSAGDRPRRAGRVKGGFAGADALPSGPP
jgi:hypothetical protein